MSENPTRTAAEAEAEKRERHKPRTLSHKRWAAVHDSTKGWHVALIDNHVEIIANGRRKVADAIRHGNFDAAYAAAGDLLMARVNSHIAELGQDFLSQENQK